VRFVGDEVVRLETMKVDGTKMVKVDKEISLEPVTKIAKDEETGRPPSAPTLRRAGEENDTAAGAELLARQSPAERADPGSTTPPNFRPYLSQNLATSGTRPLDWKGENRPGPDQIPRWRLLRKREQA